MPLRTAVGVLPPWRVRPRSPVSLVCTHLDAAPEGDVVLDDVSDLIRLWVIPNGIGVGVPVYDQAVVARLIDSGGK
jgi:hypothetical protein